MITKMINRMLNTRPMKRMPIEKSCISYKRSQVTVIGYKPMSLTISFMYPSTFDLMTA